MSTSSTLPRGKPRSGLSITSGARRHRLDAAGEHQVASPTLIGAARLVHRLEAGGAQAVDGRARHLHRQAGEQRAPCGPRCGCPRRPGWRSPCRPRRSCAGSSPLRSTAARDHVGGEVVGAHAGRARRRSGRSGCAARRGSRLPSWPRERTLAGSTSSPCSCCSRSLSPSGSCLPSGVVPGVGRRAGRLEADALARGRGASSSWTTSTRCSRRRTSAAGPGPPGAHRGRHARAGGGGRALARGAAPAPPRGDSSGLARVLIVGCGCRGRALAAGAAGRRARRAGTTRLAGSPRHRGGGHRGRGGGSRPARHDDAPARRGERRLLAARQRDGRAPRGAPRTAPGDLLERLVDTPVRGFVYEAAGTVDAELLAQRRGELVREARERWRIPAAIVDVDPRGSRGAGWRPRGRPWLGCSRGRGPALARAPSAGQPPAARRRRSRTAQVSGTAPSVQARPRARPAPRGVCSATLSGGAAARPRDGWRPSPATSASGRLHEPALVLHAARAVARWTSSAAAPAASAPSSRSETWRSARSHQPLPLERGDASGAAACARVASARRARRADRPMAAAASRARASGEERPAPARRGPALVEPGQDGADGRRLGGVRPARPARGTGRSGARSTAQDSLRRG